MTQPPLDEILATIDEWDPDIVAAGILAGDDVRITHGPVDERLPVASLTKPIAAWGVLVASTQGLVHLDEPVTVEGAERADTAGSKITIRHLLAHASGLPTESDGPVAAVGARRVYSNWGYDVLGEVVAERAGEPFAEFLDHEIFEPLGMASSDLDGSPSRAITSTVADMLAFADELRRPQLISAELHAEATSIAFDELDGVLPGFGRQRPNPWGLGVEIRGTKHPHWAGRNVDARSFGHFGQSGSFVIVDPTRDLACVSLADLAFGRWAARSWPTLIDAIVDAIDGA